MVHDVEHRDGDDRGDVEPQRHVEGRLIALRQGPEEVHRKHHPDQRHHDVDRPDEFCVFLPRVNPSGSVIAAQQ
jgi:hypothetical protein